jgi:hypothetical protein
VLSTATGTKALSRLSLGSHGGSLKWEAFAFRAFSLHRGVIVLRRETYAVDVHIKLRKSLTTFRIKKLKIMSMIQCRTMQTVEKCFLLR